MADDGIFDTSMKKKKKKGKKIVDLDATQEAEETTKNEEFVEETNKENHDTQSQKKEKEDDMNFDDFSAMKKKKKKKPKKGTEPGEEAAKDDGENDENVNEEGQENDDTFSRMKQSKLKETEIETEDTDYADREYTYDELLTRVFDTMRAKNPDAVAGEKKKFVMRPPQVVRIGTKKTSFVNFTDICKLLHRQAKHLLAFLLAELGTSGSIDGNNQLVIKGRFQQKQIESVLRRYIKEYVTCHTCRSPETLLQKETRLHFLQCEVCGSRCSVASIKSGFQAITGRRAALKSKQQ